MPFSSGRELRALTNQVIGVRNDISTLTARVTKMSTSIGAELDTIKASMDAIAADTGRIITAQGATQADITTIQQMIADLKANPGGLSAENQAKLDALDAAATSAQANLSPAADAAEAIKASTDAIVTQPAP